MEIAAYGGYLGILFQRAFFGVVWHDINYTGFKFFIFRFLIVVLLIAPFALPLLLVKWTSNLIIILVFKEMIPAFGVCFILNALSNVIFNKLRIINYHMKLEGS
jgi:hypothetical protein